MASSTYNFLNIKKQINTIIIIGCSDHLDASTLKNLD